MAVDRRNFLAGSAALASAPALGAVAASGETDVVIIGAGAAGIAAARKVAAAGRRFVVIEAGDHVGGRCVTDTRTFGVPYDRGAHWIHVPDLNPVAKLGAARRRLDVYPAPPGQKLRIAPAQRARRRDGGFPRVRSCARTARSRMRRAARPSLLRAGAAEGSRRLAAAVEFVLGPFGCGKNLDEVSADGFRPIARTRRRRVLPAGSRHAARQARRGRSGATATCRSRACSRRASGRDRDRARAASLRAPRSSRRRPACSRADRIKFDPALPKRQLDAMAKLSLGSYDHIALELASNPLGFGTTI